MRFAACLAIVALASGLSAGSVDSIPDPGYAAPLPMAQRLPATSAPVSVYQPSFKLDKQPQTRPLRHRWGFGLEYVPGATSVSVLGGVVATPNAVDLRWWATDRLGLDLAVALGANSLQGGSAANNASTSVAGYGALLGAKYNLSEPSPSLLAQLVAKVSTAQSQPNDPTGLAKLEVATTAVFAGAGFEAFVPGWEWLSLEGSAGISFQSQDVKPQSTGSGAAAAAGAAATQSSSSVSVGGSGFTPINLSIHVYF